MADSKVSSLSASSALAGTELFYADSGSADTKVTATQIQTFAQSGLVAPVSITIDGNGSTITTGLKGYVGPFPTSCTIAQADLVADRSGSIVVNVWKCTQSQFDAGSTHPAVGDKITASAPPTISSATKSEDAVLSGWTTAIAAGDILAFNVDSVTSIQRVTLTLKVTK